MRLKKKRRLKKSKAHALFIDLNIPVILHTVQCHHRDKTEVQIAIAQFGFAFFAIERPLGHG